MEAVGCMYVGSNPALCTSYLTMPFIMKFFKYNKQLNIIDIENSNIIYVNGILTSKKIALLQKRKLERLFKKTVAIIHNPTIGFLNVFLTQQLTVNLLLFSLLLKLLKIKLIIQIKK